MWRAVDRKLAAAAVIALVLLAINAVLTLTNAQQLRDALGGVSHSRAGMLGVSEVLSAAKDAETGERGYLITGNYRYLDEACRRIRESRPGYAPLVIALTAWDQDEDRRRSREAGFDAHLVKPVDLDALTRLLATIDGA